MVAAFGPGANGWRDHRAHIHGAQRDAWCQPLRCRSKGGRSASQGGLGNMRRPEKKLFLQPPRLSASLCSKMLVVTPTEIASSLWMSQGVRDCMPLQRTHRVVHLSDGYGEIL